MKPDRPRSGVFRRPAGRRTVLAVAAALAAALRAAAADYSWQKPPARVLPTGDLEWAPEPYRFAPGPSVRYIDFAGGDDDRDGRTPGTAWKRHPLDPAARGAAKAGAGAHTYVFKGGTVYRGELRGRLEGTPERPVRLAADPAWGDGPAVISGADRVTGWTRGADRADLPEPEKVWRAELPFAPRGVWIVAPDGALARLALAREPNWTVSDPDDVMGEWRTWEQPEWWTERNKTTVGGKRMHLGIDRRHLAGPAEDYVGGIVWSEWGIVMGTPFASRIEAFDGAQRGLAFQGFWYNDSGKIIAGNRYFLEDRPRFLDAPGEFWFDKRGAGGTLYVRLPGDADPNGAQVEAARRTVLVDLDAARHLSIEGLTFRCTNVFWDLAARGFVHRDVEGAAVRLLGSGHGVRIAHCRFEHVNKAVRLKAAADTDALDRVVVADNDIRFTDHGAIEIEDSSRWAKKDPPFGELGDVKVLRNRLFEIGRRPFRSDSAHALVVRFPETLEVAGNVLDRCYGAGIFVFGGKGSEETRDRPLCRMLIHHNRVTNSLLAANDWGGIETWQGGPAYVFNNVSGNANGYWNWAYRPEKPASARLGFAYYLDGAFKNYHFNNIAWGVSNDLAGRRCSHTAFYHAVPTILNLFAHNTAYNFADGSHWSPAGGRQLNLANLWLSISRRVFDHGRQKEDAGADYGRHPFETIGYARNVLHDVGAQPGFLEGAVAAPADLDGFRAAAAARKALAADVGVLAGAPPVRDAAAHDFRPVPGGAAAGGGAKFFVPWALARTVGEWNFHRNRADPAIALDEHWYMSPRVVDRDQYRRLPRHDLRGVDIAAEHYVAGTLEDWTEGAVRLDGRTRHFVLPAPAPEPGGGAPAPAPDVKRARPADWLEVEYPAAIEPGREFEVRVRLLDAPAGQRLAAHLHWLKSGGWGGFLALGRPPVREIRGEGPYAFRFVPGAPEGLDAYSILVARTPTGEWKDNTGHVAWTVPVGVPPPPAPAGFPNPHDADRRFAVEAVFRAAPGAGAGALVSDLADRGYELFLDREGRPAFLVRGEGEARAVATAKANDGAWHHVLAEADLEAGAVRLYVDGRLAAEAPARLAVGARNRADLLVGRGAAGYFAGDLDFVRIALGTLADAKTTIEELYAWQFDGPFLRDFTGAAPAGARRAAGAIDGPRQ